MATHHGIEEFPEYFLAVSATAKWNRLGLELTSVLPYDFELEFSQPNIIQDVQIAVKLDDNYFEGSNFYSPEITKTYHEPLGKGPLVWSASIVVVASSIDLSNKKLHLQSTPYPQTRDGACTMTVTISLKDGYTFGNSTPVLGGLLDSSVATNIPPGDQRSNVLVWSIPRSDRNWWPLEGEKAKGGKSTAKAEVQQLKPRPRPRPPPSWKDYKELKLDRSPAIDAIMML